MRQFRCVWATEVRTPWRSTPDMFVYAKTVPNHVQFWEQIKNGATSQYFLKIDPLIAPSDELSQQAVFEADVAAAQAVAKTIRGARAGLGVIGPPGSPHFVP